MRRPKTSEWDVKFDLTKEELDARILEPYRSGEAIVVGGRTIIPAQIEKIEIVYTDSHRSQFHEYTATFALRNDHDWAFNEPGLQNVTDEFITAPPGGSEVSTTSGATTRTDVDPRAVWVVHGRDLKLRDSIFEFLRAIDLKPLEFSSAAEITEKTSPYIGEVLDAAFSAAQAVVVIFSPDDEARLRPEHQRPEDPAHEKELTPQARPNVIFEAGMALGRQPDRTVIVEVGTLRPLSDLAGRHVIRLDDSTQRRQELARRLHVAGCPVDLSGTQWHSAGRFSPTAVLKSTQRGAAPTVTSSSRVKLSDEENRLLSIVSKDREKEQPTTEEIAQEMGLGKQQTLYFLERLEEQNLIMRAHNLYSGLTRWFLSGKGRSFAMENGLL